MPENYAQKLKDILKREKVSAEKMSKWIKVSPLSLRRMLRGEINLDVDIFNAVLDQLGYKIMIVKKEDIV